MSRYFQAFVLWRLSLAVCCASSESQSSSGRISASVSEQRDHGPFSTDVLATLTLFLLVLLNLASSRDVCPTPGVPALTSRSSVSLSFVFLTLPATSCPTRSGAPGLSLVPVSAPELHFSLVVRVPCSRSRLFSRRCGSMSPAALVQVATASWHPNAAAPSPFRLSTDIFAWFHAFPLRTSILSAGDVHL